MTLGVAWGERSPGVPAAKAAGSLRFSPLELVARVAGQLGEDLEFHQILGEIAHASRALLDIDRVSIFTLDGDYLLPAMSASRVADDHLWATFRTMPPVSLDLSSEARLLLGRGRAVEIDARVSPVVPVEWLRAFDLTYLALVPLRVANTVRGVLIADSSDPARARLTPEQLQALETVASLAGLVLERHEHVLTTTRQTADLLTVTRALAEAATAEDIARAAAEGFRDVFQATAAAVAVFDDQGAVVASAVVGAPRSEAQVWETEVSRCLDAPAEGDRVFHRGGDEILVAGLTGSAAVAVVARVWPVRVDERGLKQRAFLVLDQVRQAVLRHRSQTAESAVRQRLSDVTALAAAATSQGPISELADRLAIPVRTVARAELLDLFVYPGARARALGLRGPTAAESRRIAAWRRGASAPGLVTVDGRGLVPLVSGVHVLGAMVLRVTADSDVEALLHVGAVVGPAVEAAALRREFEDERRRNDALDARLRLDAKARAAALGRLETVLALTRFAPATTARNGTHRGVLDVERVQELARDATLDLVGAEGAAAAAWSTRTGLVGKLRALARGASRPDFAVVVRAASGTGDVESPHSSALVLAVHDVLRLAAVVRASHVVVRVSLDGGSLVIESRANGRLALADSLGGTASHVLLRALQRQVEPLGTRLELTNGGTWFAVRMRTARPATQV